MAGLLNQGMAPQQPQGERQPQGAPQPPPREPQQGQDASVNYEPDQGQQMYQVLTEAMLESLYAGEGAEQVLASHEDVVEAMGQVIATTMLTAHQALTDDGSTVPPGIMFQAAMEVAKAVGEMAVHMQRLPAEGNGEEIEAAFMMALARFGQMADDLSPAQKQRYAELIGALRDAKQESQGQAPADEPMTQGGM
ncbi:MULTISPECIES: hypothetical protein [Halomonadaceae]|uniref:hypothetical protein n=1 Tax=Halomonadaceae TaxID=28256 RepID=UPI001598F394|nr:MULTISPECIES: hypothetical protein [Halomonas]QJQ93905.1 hypothetical protein HIO72_00415 [Halomonas sp. PA5]